MDTGDPDDGGMLESLPGGEAREMHQALRTFLVGMGLDRLIGDLDEGIRHIEAELLGLALEVATAEQRGDGLADSVRDEFSYPKLFRLHASLEDVLTLALEPQLRVWAEALVESPPVELLEFIDRNLAALAVAPRAPRAHRLLAKFALFETVRIGLLIRDHLGGEDNVYAVGLSSAELDDVAEHEVDQYLALAALNPGTAPTPQTILASAMLVLSKVASDLRQTLGHLAGAGELADRARVEAGLRRLDRFDDLVLRTGVGLDENISTERLIARHPGVFVDRSANAVMIKRHRLLKSGQPVPTREERGKVAIIDLIRKAMGQ